MQSINPNAREATVTGLTDGQSYTFTLVATNGQGDSPAATYRTVQPGHRPLPPTSISATAIGDGAEVTWSLPSQDVGNATVFRNIVKAIPLNAQGHEVLSNAVYGTTYGDGTARFIAPLGESNYRIYVQTINDPGYSALPNPFTLIQNNFTPADLSGGDVLFWADFADGTSYDISGGYINLAQEKSLRAGVLDKRPPRFGGTEGFIATGFYGASQGLTSVFGSKDGITWANLDCSGGGNNWIVQPVTVAHNGSNLLLMGTFNNQLDQRLVYKSQDAVTWSPLIQLFLDTNNTVAYGNGIWLVGGQDNYGTFASHPLAISTDNASNWIIQNSPINGYGANVQCAKYNGSMWVAGGYSGSGICLMYNTNPVANSNWAAVSYPINVQVLCLDYGNGLWVAGGNSSAIYLSTDGSNWSSQNIGIAIIRGVKYANGMWMAVGDVGNGTSNATIVTSTDNFSTYTAHANKLSQNFCVEYAKGIWVAGGYNQGLNWGGMQYSKDDGQTWNFGENTASQVTLGIKYFSSLTTVSSVSTVTEYSRIGSTINGKATLHLDGTGGLTQDFINPYTNADASYDSVHGLFWVGRQGPPTGPDNGQHQNLLGHDLFKDWNARPGYFQNNDFGVGYRGVTYFSPYFANPSYEYAAGSTIRNSAYASLPVYTSSTTFLQRITGFQIPLNNYAPGYGSRFLGLGYDRYFTGRGWQGDLGEVLVTKSQTPEPIAQRIEGYLAWKWGLQDALPASHPYKGQQPTRTEPLTGICGLSNAWANIYNDGQHVGGPYNAYQKPNSYPMWWFDAADSNTLLIDTSGNVFGWLDKSGLGCTAGVNYFTGVDGSITYSNNGIQFQRSTSNNMLFWGGWSEYMTQFIVVTPHPTDLGYGYITGRPGGPGAQPAWLYSNDGTGASQYTEFYNGNGSPFVSTTAVMSFTKEDAYMFRQYMNGSIVYTNTAAADGYGAQSVWAIGGAGGGNNFAGTIHEFICYPFAMSENERQYIEGCLAWKWNTVAQLPSNHPYKTVEPTTVPALNPANIPGLQMWIDASDPVGTGTAPPNNTLLSTLVDKSGKGNHLSSVVAARLVKNSNDIYLDFKGSNDYRLDNQRASTIFVNQQAFTVFTVETQQDNPAGLNPILGSYNAANMKLFFVSDDGITWSNSPTANTLLYDGASGRGTGEKITYADGRYFLGGSYGNGFPGRVLESTDGYNWTTNPDRTSTFTSSDIGAYFVNNLIYNSTLNRWMASGGFNFGGNGGVCMYTDDPSGVTGWERATPYNINTNGCYGGQWIGDRFWFHGPNWNYALWYSTDGSTMTGVAQFQNNYSITSPISYNDSGTYVLVTNNNTPWYSTDYGSNWTSVDVTSLIGFIGDITWNGSYFVAGGVYTNQIITSPDGINWTAQPQLMSFQPFSQIYGLAANTSTGRIVAATPEGYTQFCPYPSVYSDDNGSNWNSTVMNYGGRAGFYQAQKASFLNGKWFVWGYLTAEQDKNYQLMYYPGIGFKHLFGGGDELNQNGNITYNVQGGVTRVIAQGKGYAGGHFFLEGYNGVGTGGNNAIADISGFGIGAGLDGTTHYLGKYRELLVYNGAMSVGEMLNITRYLKEKWTPREISTPLDVSGITLWLDSADPCATGAAPPLGSTIGVWRDKSPYHNDATGVGSALPYYNVDAYGKSYMRFDNTSSMAYKTQDDSMYNNKPFTIFAALESGGTSGSLMGSYLYPGIQNGSLHTVYPFNGAGIRYAFFQNDLDYNTGQYLEGGLTEVFTFQQTANLYPYNGAASRFIYRNGSNIAQDGNTALLSNDTPGDSLTIGGQLGPYPYGNLKCKEIVIHSGFLPDDQRKKIENYLKRKWRPSSYYATAPTDVSGLVMWLDGADPAGTGTLPASGSALTVWKDKSGLGHDMSGVGPNYATYSNLGRDKFVQFSDAASNYYQFPSPSFLSNTPFTIFVVDDYAGSTANSNNFNSGALFGTTSNSGNNANVIGGYGIYSESGNTSFLFYNDYGIAAGVPNVKYTNGVGKHLSIFQQRSINFNSSSPGKAMFIYNGLGTNGLVAYHDDGNVVTTPYDLTLGYTNPNTTYNGNTTYYNGRIHEFIIYKGDLSADDRIRIKNYLCRKWNIKITNVPNEPF